MITALDLRTQGLKAIDVALKDSDEGIISYKGKPKYVVIPFEKYDEFLEARLDSAYEKMVQNIQEGNYKALKTIDDIDSHIKSLEISFAY